MVIELNLPHRKPSLFGLDGAEPTGYIRWQNSIRT